MVFRSGCGTGLGAEGASSRADGDFAQAFRALARCGIGRGLLTGSRDQRVHWNHYEEIDGGRDDQER